MRLILRRLVFAAAFALVAATLGSGPAAAQADPAETYLFMVTVADRGATCGRLAGWQVAAILSETDRLLLRFPEAERQPLIDRAAARAAATPCNDAAVNQWIAAAGPGMEREWLPPNLALYRSLALMPSPPQLFLDMVGDTNLLTAVATIMAKIAELNAAGVLAEGNRPWGQYLAEVDDVAADIAAAAAGDPAAPFNRDQAIAFIVDAALIVSLWLADQ